MPRKHTTQFDSVCTSEQYDAAKDAASIAGISLAEFIRRAVGAQCENLGVAFPDNLTRRGKYKRHNDG